MVKLVRDKIPEIIKKQGKVPVFYVADEEEFRRRLKEKLLEEVNEFLKSENTEELIDILEVVYALAKIKGIVKEDLERLRMKKAKRCGTFDRRIVLKDIKDK